MCSNKGRKQKPPAHRTRLILVGYNIVLLLDIQGNRLTSSDPLLHSSLITHKQVPAGNIT